MRVIGRRGDRQHTADRLDPVSPAVIVDERDHGLNRRSSSAWAKYADALRRISLAWRSSRFSRSSAFIRSRSSVVGPARTALVALGLVAPSCAASAPCSRSSPRSRRSPPTARRDRPGAQSPSARRARAPQAKTCSSSSAFHGSILSRVGASGKPGAVHTTLWWAVDKCQFRAESKLDLQSARTIIRIVLHRLTTMPLNFNLNFLRPVLLDREMSFTAALRDLNKLNTFVRVAQRRSFTKAAAELRTRPSVISKRMKELEESLGFSLVNRSTHGLVLTDAGEGLFQHCLEMLEKLDDYVTERRNTRDRTVRHIACSSHERLRSIHSRACDDQVRKEAPWRPRSPFCRT